MSRSLILGGTRGLGHALAVESAARGIQPIVGARGANIGLIDPSLPDAEFRSLNLIEENSILRFSHQLGDADDISHVFCVAGVRLQGELRKQKVLDIRTVFETLVIGSILAVRAVHGMKKAPYHLITISSTTSWKVRNDETIYGMAHAARAQGARNFHQELIRDLPGSKSTLVCPGGMKTPFWDGSRQDVSMFMEPADVAQVIWSEVLGQQESWGEIHIQRDAAGHMMVEYGSRAPR